jgi:hypothetical protein
VANYETTMIIILKLARQISISISPRRNLTVLALLRGKEFAKLLPFSVSLVLFHVQSLHPEP